ncbi:hybrid sensor histidine kinase/response regulator transcription factor [Olivibacter sitiensis]|uniref:hybrid sensor histidine kinase/response regulator transcription factor n=1 Tax=Olivibacter sitiensis TaxID=376470 RepID=UPI001B7F93C2|nr:two-component regulator propeller domain-containing protein [Olivibacter sitiensis]
MVRFIHINSSKGLAQSPVTAMLQDHRGFVWVGNWKGLSRYDGYEFKHFLYNEQQEYGISNGRINVIFEDSKKRLWVGTANGLNLYDSQKEQFSYFGAYTLKGGLNYISNIVEDADGQIWVATFGGLCKVDLEQKKLHITAYYGQVVHSLLPLPNSTLWVGTQHGARLYHIKQKKELPLPQAMTTHAVFNKSKILIIKKDTKGRVWFGSEESGVFLYDPPKEQLTHYAFTSLPSNWIKGILPRQNGQVWIATRNGLSAFDPQQQRFKTYTHKVDDPYSLADNSVWSLMEDNQQRIWAGTFSGKLSIYSPINANFTNMGQSPTPNKGLSNTVAHYLVAESPDIIWIGTFGGGVNRWDRSNNKITHFNLNSDPADQASNHIKSMAMDAENKLWIGTLKGLYSFHVKTFQKQYHPLTGKEGKLSASLINTIFIQGKTIWAGSNGGGIYQIVPNEGHTLYSQDGTDGALSDNFVNAILPDGDSGLWIGTQMGLNYLDITKKKITKIFTKDTKPHNLSNHDILCLFRDSQERIWVGTERGSLFYFDEAKGHFHQIGEELGLTDNVVRNILEDKQKNLWISTDNGIFKVAFHRFVPPFKKEDLSITHYTSNQGLPGNMFMSNSGLVLPDNSVLFGSMDGLTSFSPQHLYIDSLAPKMAFTDFLVKNLPLAIENGEQGTLKQSITESNTIELQHDQGFFSIKYAALNYINAENNSYAYRLEGLHDDTWHYVGNQRIANYTNLNPGKYTFYVKAANSDGFWNQPLKLHIVIHPPIWATWWAYMLYAIVVLFIVTSILLFIRSKELLKRDLYHEQLKMDFFTKISHEIRTPVTLITAPLERLMSKERDNAPLLLQLSQIKAQGDRLKKLVTELLDFRKIESGNLQLYFTHSNAVRLVNNIFDEFVHVAEQKQITYHFEHALENDSIYIDADQMEKVIINLLSNAFKFTPDKGAITVSVANASPAEQQNGISIAIKNTGPEIPKAYHQRIFDPFVQVKDHSDYRGGTGIGLALAKQIVEKHGGQISLNSSNGSTTFLVFLPINAHQSLNERNVLPANIALSLIDKTVIVPEKTTTNHSTTERPYRILIVEDNDYMGGLLLEIFSESYQVALCKDGDEAWENILETFPDLIISDVMMPKVSGIELCQQVKQDERTNHIPIILLTARAAEEHQIEGVAYGADHYITKPFNPQLLELHVHNTIAAKRTLREKFAKIITLQPHDIEITSPQEQLLSKLMDKIQENMENPQFGVPELADAIGISKTVLYSKVQAITQLSVANFVKSVRLQRAAIMLKESEMNISEIAFAIGFTDRKYFSKEFKKQFNLTPSEYQNQQISAI